MKPLRDEFSFGEKIAIIYLGLYIARDSILMKIEKAYYRKKLSASSRKNWKHYFEDEFTSCLNIKIKTYQDCAYLKFKVRHLMNAVPNLRFDRKEPWQGYTIPLENVLFPVFKQS